MNYESHLEQIMNHPLFNQLIAEGNTLTPICIECVNGKPVDAFLIVSGFECKSAVYLFHKLVYDPDSDEMVKTSLSSSAEVSIPHHFVFSEEAMIYADLYEKVFSFAFAENLSPENKATLTEFLNSWKIALPSELRNSVENEFPNFFVWAQKEISYVTD